jgi:hypothetical protein
MTVFVVPRGCLCRIGNYFGKIDDDGASQYTRKFEKIIELPHLLAHYDSKKQQYVYDIPAIESFEMKYNRGDAGKIGSIT